MKQPAAIPNLWIALTENDIMNESAAHPVAVTDKDFADEVLQSDTPVLVDFWAEWCGPCRVLGPVIESLSQEYDLSLIHISEPTRRRLESRVAA